MKNVLKMVVAFAVLLVVAVSCGKEVMTIAPVDNYYLRYGIKPTDSLSFYVITNQADFDTHFAPLEGKVATPVDFEQNYVAAIVCYDTKYRVRLKVVKAERSGEDGFVDYQYTNTGEALSYTINAMCMFTVPKDITSVKFIDETATPERVNEVSWGE